MNDQELDELVAAAAPVSEAWIAALDLGDAETELMEEIMATTGTPEPVLPEPSTEPGMEPGMEPPGQPPPERSPTGGTARRFKLAVVGVAAALLVGVVVVRATGGGGDGDDGTSDVQTPSEAAVPPMLADPRPEGFEVRMVEPAEGLAPAPPSDGPIDTWVYGELTPNAVTNDVVLRMSPSPPEGDVLGEPVSVRGQQGTLCSPGPNQCDFGNNVTGVSWTEPSGAYVSVESRTFDTTQILAIADGVVVDGDTVELGNVPPDVTVPPKLTELNSDWNWTYMVDYASPDGANFSLSTMALSEAARIYHLWLAGPRGDAQVQGHDASVEDIDGAFVVVWEPSPSQLVEVLTNGVDRATALAFAETVRAASDAEWADLQGQVTSSPEDGLVDNTPAPPDGAVHRELADGSTEVWGWLGDDGGPCYQVHVDGDQSSQLCAGGSPTDVVGVSPSNVDGELIWDVPAAVGVAPEGTASIDGGEVTFGEPVDGGRLFVWELFAGEMPDSLTFRDIDGEEIATIDVVVY